MTETEDMETRVRKALSPILGVKPYAVIVDRSTLQDMHEDLWRLGRIHARIPVAGHHVWIAVACRGHDACARRIR